MARYAGEVPRQDRDTRLEDIVPSGAAASQNPCRSNRASPEPWPIASYLVKLSRRPASCKHLTWTGQRRQRPVRRPSRRARLQPHVEHGCSAGAPPAGLGIHAGGLDLLAKPSCLCQLRPTHIVMLRRERRVLTLAFDSSFLRCTTFVDSSRRFESLLWLGRSSTLRP